MISFISNVSAQLTGQSLIAIGVATAAGAVIGAICYRLLGEAWRRAASIEPETARVQIDKHLPDRRRRLYTAGVGALRRDLARHFRRDELKGQHYRGASSLVGFHR